MMTPVEVQRSTKRLCSELFFQQLSQSKPCPGHPGLYRARGQAQDLSDLLVGGPIELPENQYLPMLFRQQGQPPDYGPAQFLLF